MNIFDLSGRKALVCGGAGYIGQAICRELTRQGASISILDVNREVADQVADVIANENNTRCFVYEADVTQEQQVHDAVKQAAREHGALDIVVHAVGLISSVGLQGYAVPFDQQTLATWRQAIDVNLTSAFILAQAVETSLKKSMCGSLVLLSSIYGQCGPNMALYAETGMGNPSAYGASKGGIQQLMKYLATQWAPEVRVNCVSPGGIKRRQPEQFIERYEALTPMRRMAEPEDIAGPVVFLASDAARYVTGQNLCVDGGWTAW